MMSRILRSGEPEVPKEDQKRNILSAKFVDINKRSINKVQGCFPLFYFTSFVRSQNPNIIKQYLFKFYNLIVVLMIFR